MSLFAFNIWDKKRMATFNDDGEMVMVPHPTDTDWIKRILEIETDEIRITSFQEDEIFADQYKSKACVQVYLSDEDSVFAAYTLNAWTKLYNEVYKPLIPKTLGDIVNDLKGPEGED